MVHQHPKYNRRAQRIIRQIKAGAGQFKVWEDPEGIRFGTDELSIAIAPMLLTVAENDNVGSSGQGTAEGLNDATLKNKILSHLSTTHPDLFTPIQGRGEHASIQWLQMICDQFQK